MWTGHRRLRATLMIVVGVALTGLVMVLAIVDPARQLELDTVDARFKVRGDEPPPRGVVDVDIDARTFQELDVLWPFPRTMHAAVIRELDRAGAKVIAYDVQFTEQTGRGDIALMKAVDRARARVVLATSEVNERGESEVFGSEQTVRSLGARSANALLPTDPDGIIRRVPYEVDGLTGFAVAAVEAAEKRRISRAEFGGDSAWIDFHGAPGTITSVSFSDVLERRIDRDIFRDKIVVVGATAPSEQDNNPTSVGGNAPMSGVEIHANGISTVLRQTPLEESGRGVVLALVAFLGMLVPLAAIRLGTRRGAWALALFAGLAAVVAAIYLAVAQLAFDAGVILPVLYPLLALVLGAIGVLEVELTSVVMERDRVHERFSRYVPESVVDEVLRATDDDLCLGGTRLQSTVVFCDLRDFTGWAELRPAEQVIEALNFYLAEMSEAIRARGGTLVDYQGDGIVAAFGAPLEQDDHADRAVEAVRDMVGPRLEAFNAWLRDHDGGAGFRIGIGVNSGVVMSGNVGCRFRLEYTVIGDTANTASRLEKLTKELPHQVLISDTTRAMLRREAPDLRYVDATEVRGKQVKANLWTLDAPGVPRELAGMTATSDAS